MLRETSVEIINEVVGKALDMYYQKRDADSFFALVEYNKMCNEMKLTREDIPRLIEMKNVIVMG